MTEAEAGAMLEKTMRFGSTVVEGRLMIHVRHLQRPWIVIVEPGAEADRA